MVFRLYLDHLEYEIIIMIMIMIMIMIIIITTVIITVITVIILRQFFLVGLSTLYQPPSTLKE
jgi:hypothetical protein